MDPNLGCTRSEPRSDRTYLSSLIYPHYSLQLVSDAVAVATLISLTSLYE